jgi:hypothetical protein
MFYNFCYLFYKIYSKQKIVYLFSNKQSKTSPQLQTLFLLHRDKNNQKKIVVLLSMRTTPIL